jgi:hypothetical protein
MSRRAAGFIKEWWIGQLQRGPIRLDPEEIRGPGVASWLEADAFNYCGIPRHELEEAVGDLDMFFLKIVDGEITPDSIRPEDHPEAYGDHPYAQRQRQQKP